MNLGCAINSFIRVIWDFRVKIMCGIFGYYSSGAPIDLVSEKRLDNSLSVLHHRGPDSFGKFTSSNRLLYFSHTRLAINDLSSLGHQPMRFGHYVIVFNGEIYNFKQLKAKLIREHNIVFETNTDTEVLLALYKIYREKCVDFLDGMFAFGIYDEILDNLFLARDPIGEKPLVYSERKEGFYFCSEIPGILKTSPEKIIAKTDLLPLISAGNHRHIPDPLTLWEGIYRLEPGHFLNVKNGKIIEHRKYWNPKFLSNSSNISDFKELIINSVERTTVGDVPITMLLSGGVDSSIIAQILRQELNHKFEAFVYGWDNDDEEVLRAKQVAKYLDIPLRVITRKQVNLDDFDSVVSAYGEPVPLLPLLYNVSIMKAVKDTGYKVVLTGSGADEIFYGYTGHLSTFRRTKILDKLPVEIKNQIFPILKFAKSYFSSNPGELTRNCKWFKHVDRKIPSFNSYIDYSNYFGLIYENAHSICLSSDIAASLYGLEQRSPFLNKSLVEKCFSTEVSTKIYNETGPQLKNILKQLFKDKLPETVFSSKKIGFGYYSKENAFNMTTAGFIENEVKRWKSCYDV